jgi:hypothetical protein
MLEKIIGLRYLGLTAAGFTPFWLLLPAEGEIIFPPPTVLGGTVPIPPALGFEAPYPFLAFVVP